MCLEICIGKYIKGAGLEDALVGIGVFGVKVMESVLAATNYERSLRGIQIRSGAIELVKWIAFWKDNDTNDFKNSVQVIKKFEESLYKKHRQSCLNLREKLKNEIKTLMQQFMEFSKTCQLRSEVCRSQWEWERGTE